jgi:hypothetical protein
MQNAEWEMGNIKSIPKGLNENSPVRQCGEKRAVTISPLTLIKLTDHPERRIDELVCRLYRLTED